METFKVRAYVYLLYRVLLDIRSASYTHRIKWWNPISWVRVKNNVIEINNISDVFHNLPDLIANRPEEFDEISFWDYLRNRLPEKYEFYNKFFNEKINEIDHTTN